MRALPPHLQINMPRHYADEPELMTVPIAGEIDSDVARTGHTGALLRDAPTSYQHKGLRLERLFTRKGTHPFDEVVWDIRTARIAGEGGNAVFVQEGVESPSQWSQLAINVVASKYFRGKLGTVERETSVRQLISRVVATVTAWGRAGKYFADEESAHVFSDELTHLLLFQKMSFNSPVWFNVGVVETPQCSACFILSIEDNMESILNWIKDEGMIFKGGSGSGINLSSLRSSKEKLSKGGIASGPVSFMRGADASAGAIKSGGTTRRAAKMVILNSDHPDIVEFIRSKEIEEKKAWALGEAGYDMGLNGEAWRSIQFQNANNSVRATDEFMNAAMEDRDWHTRTVTSGEIVDTFKARDLLRMIAEATWVCGDPGMQFDTIINDWHTCPHTGRINASNPCSEYMHLDNSACNLASLNLMKFVRADGELDVQSFKRAVDITFLAQEIMVGGSGYPTPQIAKNARAYREIGLGYANLGALLMSRGLPYDSDAGRAYAAAITALMTGEAYAQSARIAGAIGPFAGYEKNKEPMQRVIRKHEDATTHIAENLVPRDLLKAAGSVWSEARTLGEIHGYRNSQATVLAPTGTIAFMMDCDTTGVEPDIALVKYKTLVGGGTVRMVNQTIPKALAALGYHGKEIDEIVSFVEAQGTIEGAPHVHAEHLPVFDCAFKPERGSRSIHYLGHIKMMGAVQPFISGAISKTVNMPKDASVEDIMQTYIEGWKQGLKALAIYRDGSKRTQPLSTGNGTQNHAASEPLTHSARRHLPSERKSLTHKFSIAGHEGYITVGLYEDGTPGEIFITMAKEGSTISGVMDAFATAISVSLQYGVPLKSLVRKFSHMRFEPSGFTGNEHIPFAKSVLDYIFRWLELRFLAADDAHSDAGVPLPLDALPKDGNGNGHTIPARAPQIESSSPQDHEWDGVQAEKSVSQTGNGNGNGNGHSIAAFTNQEDAPLCSSCGSIMVRNAACYRCFNCGETSGCS